MQNNKVNGNGIILIYNYLKCKWVECPKQKIKTGWMDTKTRPLYMLSTRDPPQNKGHIQTESEGLEKNIWHKWRPKESRNSILISDKIDVEIKPLKTDEEGHYIMTDQRINPRRRYNNYKYICTQHRSTTIYKANTNKYERGN